LRAANIFLIVLLQAAVVLLYEVMRASVVVKLTAAAGLAIAPSQFSFALFGPIFCGTIAGCGGAFLPLSKGLDPIKENGLAPNMFSAFIGALFYHLFLNTSLSLGVALAPKKAAVIVAAWFILHGWYSAGIFQSMFGAAAPAKSAPAKSAPAKSTKSAAAPVKTKVKKES
jgi:hypothetical protein